MYLSTLKKLFIMILFIHILTINVYASVNQVVIERFNLSEDIGLNSNVYLVVLNRTNLEDIISLDNVKTLAEEGSIGLMNTKGMYGYNEPESYMTINSSSRAYANNATSFFVNVESNDKYNEMYRRRIGNEIGNCEIVNTEFNILLKQNEGKEYSPYIGALGRNLHNSNLKTAVFGNSDTADSFIRTNCLIATDEKGCIDYGNVDKVLVKDETYPFGLKTDYGLIIRKIKEIRTKASFIVIEVGDLNRLNYYSENLNDKMYKYHRSRILNDADAFLASIIEMAKKDKDLVIVLSPNAADGRLDDTTRITPIVMWGNGVEKGVLSSGTTRRRGIVSNIDIAPSISKHFNADSTNYSGTPITYVRMDNNIEHIMKLSQRTNSVSQLRYPVLSFYNIVTIIILLSVTIYVISRKNNISIKAAKIMRLLLNIVLTFPPGLLVLSLFRISDFSIYIFFLIIYIVSVNLIIALFNNSAKVMILTSMTFLLIVLDILTGGNLVKFSTLGYDPIIGARYFGIGNELVGVLLGSTILSMSLYINKTNRKNIPVILLFLTSFLVVHPTFGANVGGTISIFFASLYFGFRVHKIEINIKMMILFFSVITLFVLMMAFIDINYSKTPSHLGKAILLFIQKGPMPLVSIIIRKLQVNIRLMGVTIWSKTLMTTITIIIALLYFMRNTISEVFNKNRYVSIGIVSSLLGSIIGFLVNDSGILLASISNIYTTTVLLYVTIGYMQNNVHCRDG